MDRSITDERLLRALAEQLKLPLLQIARQAEQANNSSAAPLESINVIADMSLRLIDGFLLSFERSDQHTLILEPVSISSLLYDTAQILQPLAHYHDCELEVEPAGRYRPVMAHEKSLQAAFVLLGYSLMESRQRESKNQRLVLAAHRSARGVVTGLFGGQPDLTSDMLRRGQALYGRARQTLPALSAGSGAGLFVADSLLHNMASGLHLARHHHMTGLATTLVTSKQLQLVE